MSDEMMDWCKQWDVYPTWDIFCVNKNCSEHGFPSPCSYCKVRHSFQALHDPSVGIRGVIVSPWLDSLVELEAWWNDAANRKSIETRVDAGK